MNDDELFSQVNITDNGAICLGESLVCDGFEPGYKAAVFTHIHSDHISKSFETCMHQYHVYTSKITAELLESITEDTYIGRTQFDPIDYDSPKMIKYDGKGDVLTLIESKHMLGSSQVFLQTHDKLKILYSGDISPDDHPPKCDVLVIDSTHGDPRFDKIIDNQSLERRLLEVITESIDNGKPVCVHAHRGRLQHIMHLLSNHKDIPETVPFLATRTDYQVAQIYHKYGISVREMVDLDSYAADEITHDIYPWIEFRANSLLTKREEKGQVTNVAVMGGFGSATMLGGDGKYWIAADDHAEFSDLLRYVKEADPQVVVTDNFRASFGDRLAKEINSRLGIPTKSLPELKND
jgi:putative mRNA 3-end processing factor